MVALALALIVSLLSFTRAELGQDLAPSDSNRHVGDLGNFETDAQGNSKGSISDNQVKLIGPESVLGVSGGRKIILDFHRPLSTDGCILLDPS